MFIDILLNILSRSINVTPEVKHEDLVNAYNEIYEVACKMKEYGDWDAAVTVIPTYTLVNLLNECTYDELGRYLKEIKTRFNKSPSYIDAKHKYRDIVSSHMGLYDLTIRQIDDAGDFMTDLWNDNESCNSNLSDGSFHNTDAEIARKLFNLHTELSPDKLVSDIAEAARLTPLEVGRLRTILCIN